MAVRVTAAHTAEARAEAGREAGEGGVAAAAALSSGGFLGLPAPFSEEGNEATEACTARVRAALPGLWCTVSPGSGLLECLQTLTTLPGFPSDHL